MKLGAVFLQNKFEEGVQGLCCVPEKGFDGYGGVKGDRFEKMPGLQAVFRIYFFLWDYFFH
ncbi:hypothetical protein D3C83_243480 [compost metagenome]